MCTCVCVCLLFDVRAEGVFVVVVVVLHTTHQYKIIVKVEKNQINMMSTSIPDVQKQININTHIHAQLPLTEPYLYSLISTSR
jgi:hypothetical protein